LLSFLQNTHSFKAGHCSLERQISFQFESLFFQAEAFQIGNGRLESIALGATTNAFSAALGFSIENHTSTTVPNTVGTGHDGETVGLNSIGKKEALFELGEGSLWGWHVEKKGRPWRS
jgi:hypothetical protein